jgi:precorrin-6B methylase 2
LARLGEVEGVRWVSLQKGQAAGEAEAPPPGLELVNLGPELEDFCDTAAVIDQLDLVLCVDTAVAHLAGALGKPVWVLLPSPADWRWLEGREDSPWYPTMRLFRQSRRGEWEDVIERVKVALQERLRDGASATVPSANRRPQVLPAPEPPVVALPSQAPGHRPGFSAVAECRYGILQYLPDEAVGDSLGWYGEYLQPQLDFLARLIRPGATVLEVGAGVGEHALFLAATIGEGGHLFLYESRPVVKRILQQNLGANRITNVTLMRRTLGAKGEAADRGSETLDELQLERLDWLKINGSVLALEVLDGGADTLWRLRPLMFLAAADEPVLTALASRVKEFSYRCWRMETALFNPQNFNRREADIFSGRTALALLAIPEEIEVDIALDRCVEIS